MKIKDIMTKKVVAFSPDDTLEYAIKKLVKNKISGAPVIENDKKVVGIVTESDIIKTVDVFLPQVRFDTDNVFALVLTTIKSKDIFSSVRHDMIKAGKLLVKDAMCDRPICIEPEKNVIDAARLMNKYDVDRLPVVKNKKLVGIIARADIIKALGSK